MPHSFLPFKSALSGASSPSRFVAIYMDASDGGQFLSITPKMMRWTANVYQERSPSASSTSRLRCFIVSSFTLVDHVNRLNE